MTKEINSNKKQTQQYYLSIIIVSWNNWRALNECLKSIFSQNFLKSFEIIIIDNNSCDGSPSLIRENYPQVKLHVFNSNLGHTKAVNYGFKNASSSYILLLDQDTILMDSCLEKLVDFLDERTDVFMVAPRTFNTDGSIQETARNFPSPMSAFFGRQSFITKIWPNNPYSHAYLSRQNLKLSSPFQVEQIGGACMLFRSELINIIGYWDEKYFAYWVDTDWCYRCKERALPIYCLPDAQLVHHEGNAKGKRKSARRIWHFNFGAWQIYTRWNTCGRFDPRSILAATALSLRTITQLVVNLTK